MATDDSVSAESEYVNARWVMAHYSISEASVWRWVKNKTLPPPVRIGPNCSRWKRSTLLEFERDRAQSAGSAA